MTRLQTEAIEREQEAFERLLKSEHASLREVRAKLVKALRTQRDAANALLAELGE